MKKYIGFAIVGLAMVAFFGLPRVSHAQTDESYDFDSTSFDDGTVEVTATDSNLTVVHDVLCPKLRPILAKRLTPEIACKIVCSLKDAGCTDLAGDAIGCNCP